MQPQNNKSNKVTDNYNYSPMLEQKQKEQKGNELFRVFWGFFSGHYSN